jgi:endonuclease YncB( thermonuclease family)
MIKKSCLNRFQDLFYILSFVDNIGEERQRRNGDCEMTAFRFQTALLAMIFFAFATSHAFADGKGHVEGQFSFPFSSKKTVKDTKTWSGLVVGVTDGDRITVLHKGEGEKIRLYGIDAPDIGQAFDQKAKQFTFNAVYGKTVNVETRGKDLYGRTVGIVTIDGQSLNESLIQNGLAWVYQKYCTAAFCENWLNLEIVARYDKIGLWSEPNPVPPWEFRQGK